MVVMVMVMVMVVVVMVMVMLKVMVVIATVIVKVVRPPKIHGADDDEGAQEHEELIVELRVRAVVCVRVCACACVCVCLYSLIISVQGLMTGTHLRSPSEQQPVFNARAAAPPPPASAGAGWSPE